MIIVIQSFLSNQFGIEIRPHYSSPWSRLAFYRTSLELKFIDCEEFLINKDFLSNQFGIEIGIDETTSRISGPFYRTSLELKYWKAYARSNKQYPFYRTSLELKSTDAELGDYAGHAFLSNQFGIEIAVSASIAVRVMLFIEPVWN